MSGVLDGGLVCWRMDGGSEEAEIEGGTGGGVGMREPHGKVSHGFNADGRR